MSESKFKWRATFDDLRTGKGFRLALLRTAKGIGPSYIHKPGDIDYRDLKYLSPEVKTDVRRYIREGHVPDDSKWPAVSIAACILVDRLTDPNFVPKELLPFFWEK